MQNYIHFTEEQKQAARGINLVVFLEKRGEKLKRSGGEYEWVGHHITIRENVFYDHYEQRGGTAVDFVREQFRLSYPEAVQLLLGENVVVQTFELPKNEIKRSEFFLPPANGNMRRAFAYLIKKRFIDKTVISRFAHMGLIYEDAKYHNVVFVGKDKHGVPRHAHKKSTSLNDSSYRGNQAGSDAAFSFHYLGNSEKVYVFEAPIDMLSFITLYPENWNQHSYLSLCSVADRALFYQLGENPNLQNIVLCLDNDEAGHLATERIFEKLNAQRYTQVEILIPSLKDWNDELKILKTEVVQCQGMSL